MQRFPGTVEPPPALNQAPPPYTAATAYPTTQYGVQLNQVGIHPVDQSVVQRNFGVPLGKSYLTSKAAGLLYCNLIGTMICMILAFKYHMPEEIREKNILLNVTRMVCPLAFGQLAFFLISVIVDPKLRCGKSLKFVHIRTCRSIGFTGIILGIVSFLLLLHSMKVEIPGIWQSDSTWYKHEHECEYHDNKCLTLKVTGVIGTLSAAGMVMEAYLHYLDAKNS